MSRSNDKNKQQKERLWQVEPVAAGGLLHRRAFLEAGVKVTGAAGVAAVVPGTAAAAMSAGENAPPWMKTPGAGFREYGAPSPHEAAVKRAVLKPYGDLAPGTGVTLTPLQSLHGTITPNGLHFERSHNGTPDIDPAKHEVILHGMVNQPLVFTMDSLMRYPTVSRQCFIECSGNSFFNSNLFPEAMQVPVGHIHGLVSCSEWTGIPLSTLLDEAGVDPKASWILAEGADAAGMSRSIPLNKAMDDTMVALYQNGERLRPEQGYPLRLVLPGFEGNMHVKWLRRIKVTDAPTHTKDETSKYTELQPDGMAQQFTYTMGVKSTITRPATGLAMKGPGYYEVSGLAWTGHGSIRRVEVSADGGKTWADAEINGPVISHSMVRFRLPWHWDGSNAVLQSRAHDDKGNVQLGRADWSKQYAAGQLYHCNAIQSWEITPAGEVKNVYV